MRKLGAILAIGLLVCLSAGCGQKKGNPSEISSISVLKEGGIKHHIAGSFEQNYYDGEGLKNLAEDRVKEYQDKNGKDSVVLESVDEKDGKVSIDFTYLSGEDYMRFNHRELFAGTVAQAKESGYELDRVALVTGAGEPIEADEIEGLDEKGIVIIATKPSEELTVNVYNKIQYLSQGAVNGIEMVFDGKKSVRIRHPEDAEAKKTVLSYIIF